jgi:hypothetical protein
MRYKSVGSARKRSTKSWGDVATPRIRSITYARLYPGGRRSGRGHPVPVAWRGGHCREGPVCIYAPATYIRPMGGKVPPIYGPSGGDPMMLSVSHKKME